MRKKAFSTKQLLKQVYRALNDKAVIADLKKCMTAYLDPRTKVNGTQFG